MKTLLIGLVISLITTTCFGQEKILATNQFIVEGKIKKPAFFSIKDINGLEPAILGNITTLNSEGVVKTVKKNVKGVLLRKLLASIEIDVLKPKERASCYLVFIGSDGYKVVLSFNEVFNQNNIYVVTESDGNNIAKSEGRIEVLVLMENFRGHIAMKGLEKILVAQI